MSQQEHVHFIGIGGSGMSAIAKVLVEMGYHVSGSDIYEHELLKQLQAQGVKIYIGHDPINVDGADYVVYSTGIPEENVEKKIAREKGIPLFHRAQMLAKLLNQKEGIAITGAHGKTTTSSMVTLVMTEAGLDPTFLIGGEVLDFGYNAKAGKSEYVVAEADESDASFLRYHPSIAIITNIEPDHLENYKGDFEQLKAAYVQFIRQIKPQGKLIVCVDDPTLQQLLRRDDVVDSVKANNIDLITYSIHDPYSRIMAREIVLENRLSTFTVVWENERIGEIKLSIPGEHNVLNALSAIALGLTLGIPFPEIQQALQKFVGAKRRFQVISEEKDVLIVDDYAHHPTEIMATIEAAKSTNRRIIAIFQPQRYTRTYYLLDAFSFAFKEANTVIISEIYSPVGEKPIEGVSGEELANRIRNNSNDQVFYFKTKEQIINHLIQHVRPGDLILTMGAGDIWKVAYSLSHYLSNLEQMSE